MLQNVGLQAEIKGLREDTCQVTKGSFSYIPEFSLL